MVGLEPHDRFLLAVAGDRPEQLPESISDVDALVKRIREHRLEGRCLRHRRAIEARRYPSDLVERVENLSRATRAEFTRNLDALSALTERLGGPFGVVIKGFTTYLTTGDEATLRCGDIDVVVANADAVIGALQEQDYEQTRWPFMHEIGEYARDGVEIDLQWGFPVCHYPDALEFVGAEVQAAGLMQTAHFAADFLWQRSQPIGPVRIPSPELHALICASHAFMNYANIWSISHREKAWLRLSELADIVELARGGYLSGDHLRDLAASYPVQDVVRWTDRMCTRLFDYAPFAILGEDPPEGPSPLCLWWNLWVRTEPGPELLLRDRWYPMREIANALDRAPSSWAAPEYRGIYAISVNDGEITVVHPAGEPPDAIRARIDLGTKATEVFAGSEVTVTGDAIAVASDRADGRWTLRFDPRGSGLVAVAVVRDDQHVASMATVVRGPG
jgi:hypothetical protein